MKTGVCAVLLEFPDEAEAFLAYCRREGLSVDRFHVVALWPSVQVALRKHGVRYEDTRPYFGNESHHRILRLSEEWLQIIEAEIQLKDGTPIQESYNEIFVFQLRFYLNYFLWVVEVLRSLVRQHELDSIWVGRNRPSGSARSGPNLEFSDRYLSDIAKAFGAKRGVRVEEIPPGSAKATTRQGVIRQALQRVATRGLSFVSTRLHRRVLAAAGTKPTILVNTLSYNMDRLVRELKQEFPGVRIVWLQTAPVAPAIALCRLLYHLPADDFLSLTAFEKDSDDCKMAQTRMTRSLEETRSLLHDKWKATFSYEQVSFIDVFASKIEGDLFAHLQGLVRRSHAVQEVLELLKPSLVVSPMSAWADAVLGEWTRVLGVSSLSVSHGTFTPPATREDEIEEYRLGTSIILTTYQHTAAQTPWAERYLAHFEQKRRAVPVKTGNLIFARRDPALRATVRKELLGETGSERMKVIVYATTLKPRSGLRFQIHETLDEHLGGIADLARTVHNLKNTFLIIKLHPAAALKEDEVRLLVPESDNERVRVMCRVPFEQVLAAADLLVSYSSTCIEEAIQNRLPVLLYDPWDRYQHLSALRWGKEELKSSPAYYVNEAKSLEPAVQWILSNHDSHAVPEAQWAEHVYPEEVRGEFLNFVSRSLQNEPHKRQAAHA